MSEARTQGRLVPPDVLGPLIEATQYLEDPSCLREMFEQHGYLLLRGVLNRGAVLEARRAVFSRMAEMGEIQKPAEDGIPTGRSRRLERVADLGVFWKSVSESAELRAVTHGSQLRDVMSMILGETARPHDYLFLRPAPVGNATNLHYDYPFFAGGASSIATCWIPLGDIPVENGPLAVVENSHRFGDLIDPIRSAALAASAEAFAAAQEAAYQESATETLAFVQSRQTRLLTTHFHPGDLMVFGGFTMHGSLDNHVPSGRVRLSVDVRYQLESDPADDPRYFGSDPLGAKGGSYGEQKAAQPLGTPWAAKQ